jgi:hypothetical protein
MACNYAIPILAHFGHRPDPHVPRITRSSVAPRAPSAFDYMTERLTSAAMIALFCLFPALFRLAVQVEEPT